MASAGKADAKFSSDVAHDGGLWALPFVSEFPGNGFEESVCFLTKDTICGGNKRGKMTTLLLACFEIVALLLRLFCTEDFLRSLGVVGLGIEINDGDINDN